MCGLICRLEDVHAKVYPVCMPLYVVLQVHHPNAVQFLGACTKQEPYVLVTELMTGGSLSDAMRMERKFTLRRAMEIAVDTARGLAYMHNRKPGAIIHRDLKPGNLMISGSQYHSRCRCSLASALALGMTNPHGLQHEWYSLQFPSGLFGYGLR